MVVACKYPDVDIPLVGTPRTQAFTLDFINECLTTEQTGALYGYPSLRVVEANSKSSQTSSPASASSSSTSTTVTHAALASVVAHVKQDDIEWLARVLGRALLPDGGASLLPSLHRYLTCFYLRVNPDKVRGSFLCVSVLLFCRYF